jgi:tetratricopeptide (TPR) repeat protein
MSDNREHELFPVGSLVHLQHLRSASFLNGRHGIVATGLLEDGRIGVDLDEGWDLNAKQIVHKRLNIKPCNLKLQTTHEHPHHCDYCQEKKPVSELFECGKCKLLAYCSKRCQKEHWHSEHKKQCKELRKARKKKLHEDYHLVDANLSTIEEILKSARQLRLIGDRYAAKGDYSNAIGVYKKAKKILNTENILHRVCWYHINALLGSALRQLGQLGQARQVLEESIRMVERSPQAITFEGSETRSGDIESEQYSNYGSLLMDLNEYEAAYKAYEKAHDLDPTDPIFLRGKAEALVSQRKFQEATEVYCKFLKASTDTSTEIEACVYDRLAYCSFCSVTKNHSWDSILLAKQLPSTESLRIAEKAFQLTIRCWEKAENLDPVNSKVYDVKKQVSFMFLSWIRDVLRERNEGPCRYSLKNTIQSGVFPVSGW